MVIFLIKSYFNKCYYKFKHIYSLRKQAIQNDKNFTNHGSNYVGITTVSVCKHIVTQYLLKTFSKCDFPNILIDLTTAQNTPYTWLNILTVAFQLCHRITNHELGNTHKDDEVQLLAVHRTSTRITPMCPKALANASCILSGLVL